MWSSRVKYLFSTILRQNFKLCISHLMSKTLLYLCNFSLWTQEIWVVFIMILCMYKMNTWSKGMGPASWAWHLVTCLELNNTIFFPLKMKVCWISNLVLLSVFHNVIRLKDHNIAFPAIYRQWWGKKWKNHADEEMFWIGVGSKIWGFCRAWVGSYVTEPAGNIWGSPVSK